MVQLIARSQYDERPAFPSDLSFEGDKGVTKQADMKDADINAIFKRFERTGELPNMIVKTPHYGDYSEVPTYQEALNIVKLANEQFEALDVDLRNRFENDPSKFLAFVNDAKNADKLEDMGLLKPEVVAARQAARKAKADEADAKAKTDRENAEKAFIAKIKAAL